MNGQIRNLVLDLSSAMFRVASIIGHEHLRSEMEKSAITLSVSCDFVSIDRAHNIILLGREVEEIKSVNASVLVRELNNLRKLIEEDAHSRKEIDLSSLFSSNHSFSDSNEIVKPAAFKTSSFSKPEAQLKTNTSGSNEGAVKKYNAVNSDMVFSYIKEKGTAKLKELESAFPLVSGRTIRRITDQLIKEKMIDRVGNPGPTSFYRPRPLVSANPVPTRADFLPSTPLESPFVRPVIQENAEAHKFSF